MENYETLKYEKVEDKIFRLTLNRPEKLNTLTPQMFTELEQVMSEYESNPEASVMIIRGAGRCFSAGHDLQGNRDSGSTYAVSNDRLRMHKTIERWQRLWAINKPTIAQVHGYCLAAASEFIGHCDIVFASEDAVFGHPAGRALGVLPTLAMWPLLMGPRKSKEYFFTGDLMGAKEALESHLINRVYPKDKLEEETLNYARRVALIPAELLMLHKAAINRYYEILGIRAAEQSSADIDVISHQTDSMKNWLKAVREKGLKEALSERDGPFAKKN
jgi:enoyl-CoA hydratase